MWHPNSIRCTEENRKKVIWMIRSWARRVCRRLSRTNRISMTSDHPERSAKKDVPAVIMIWVNLSQSQGRFSQYQLFLAFRRTVCLSVLLFFKVFEGKTWIQGDKKEAKTSTWHEELDWNLLLWVTCNKSSRKRWFLGPHRSENMEAGRTSRRNGDLSSLLWHHRGLDSRTICLCMSAFNFRMKTELERT